MFLCMFIAWNGIEGFFQLLMKHFFGGLIALIRGQRVDTFDRRFPYGLGSTKLSGNFAISKRSIFTKPGLHKILLSILGEVMYSRRKSFLRTPWFFDGRYGERFINPKNPYKSETAAWKRPTISRVNACLCSMSRGCRFVLP